MIRTLLFFILFCVVSTASFAAENACDNNTQFNVGAGIYDITGPAAEQTMMGYAMTYQKTKGIYSRLWARAFVIESPCNGKRVVFVNADLGQLFQGIKQQVIIKLQKKYGKLYTDDNVLLTAIHTHSGPGGYSTYTLYNLSTYGFSRENFNTIIDGIVAAIDRAHKNVVPAVIKIAKGELSGVGFNRSPQSYLKNPEAERAQYKTNVDTEMTLIRFDTLDGKPIGLINWFPVHGVSMNNKNRLINGDNKGYAEYLFEKDFNSDYGPHAFIAAFAQSNAGDVSPNEYGKEGGEGLAGLKAIEKAGRPQYEEAKKLFNSAVEIVKGGVDFRHQFVQMDKMAIEPQWTDGRLHTNCSPAIGLSMLAGTSDGEGVGKQGQTCEEASKTVPDIVCDMLTTPCQGAKPIAIDLGNKSPYPWVPLVLPFQVFKLGSLIIASTPFEITTMSGRRLRKTIRQELPVKENYHVVLSTLSNAYVQYITTHEEYQLQRYEGASTIFGPWALASLQQEYAYLTRALMRNLSVTKGPSPIDLSDFQLSFQPGVVYDDKPIGKKFGDVYINPRVSYKAGDTVKTVFWGAHPKNNFRTQRTFLEVQQLVDGHWHTIRRDRDWDTEYHWERDGLANSQITIVWRMPKDTPAGKYRMVHHGDWKIFGSGKITPYAGYSSSFTVTK